MKTTRFSPVWSRVAQMHASAGVSASCTRVRAESPMRGFSFSHVAVAAGRVTRHVRPHYSSLAVATTDVTISFRPLREVDLPLLHDWIHRPHVAEWWGGRDAGENLEDTKKKYLPRLQEGSSIKSYIALLSGEPIGFIQSYVALGCGDGWWEDETDPGVRGIDQFLCDGGKLGQGLGSRMVAAFVRKLFADPGVTKVQTDPDPKNARAIRCYEKAGFRPVEKVATPDGPALLMTVARAAVEERANAA